MSGRATPCRERAHTHAVTRLADELRAVLGGREPEPSGPAQSPAAIEEEAATRLYGERTGTVNASPASPPVARSPEGQAAPLERETLAAD